MFSFPLLPMPAGFVLASLCLSSLKESTCRRRWLTLPSSILLAIGAIGFFGQGLSAVGALNWMPHSIEWPAGYADHALKTTDGDHIVLIEGAGRIQVYDPAWHFVRGWAAGPVLKLRLLADGTIEALTKGQRGLVFDLNGKLLSQRRYGIHEWIVIQNSLPPGESLWVRTSPWLFIGSNPLWSWLVAALGSAGWFASQVRKAR